MPNTLLTLEPPTPPMTLLGNACYPTSAEFGGPVVQPLGAGGIDDFRRATRETERLLSALQAMPALPFANLLWGQHLEPPGLPSAPLHPPEAPAPVLSTSPCARDPDGAPSWPAPGREGEAAKTTPESSEPRSDSERASPSAGYSVKAKAKNAKKHNPALKIWCHFFIEPAMLRHGFDVNKKLIGHGGANTKRIYEETGAKIRLRGRGSGHHEGERGEAPVPLMLAVTSDLRNQDNFMTALDMSAQLLQTVTNKYPDFCKVHGWSPVPGPLFWVGELSQEALGCLGRVSEAAVQIGKVAVALGPEAAERPAPPKRAGKARGQEAALQ